MEMRERKGKEGRDREREEEIGDFST